MEYARAAPIGAAPDAQEFTTDERFGGRFNDRNHEASEGITDRHEALAERSVVTEFHATVPGAATEHAIDLDERIGTGLLHNRTTLGERAQGGADTAGIDERGRSTSRLLLRTARDANGTLGIEYASGAEPLNEGIEVAQDVHAHTAPEVVRVYEVQPEPLADENEGRRGNDHLGQNTGGLRGNKSHWRQAYVSTLATASEITCRVAGSGSRLDAGR